MILQATAAAWTTYSDYEIGMYWILLRCRIVVRIVYSYSDEQCHQNEYE